MSATLTLPRLGETMEEGRVVVWIVEEGAAFSRGDVLLEVETDKTVVEVPALGPGRVIERLVNEGDAVTLGAALARLEIDGPDWTESATGDGQADPDAATSGATNRPPTDQAEAVRQNATRAEGAPWRPEALEMSSSAGRTREPEPAWASGSRAETAPLARDPVRATPLARRLARQRGIDIRTIKGTGRRGRIEQSDIPDRDAAPALRSARSQAGNTPILLLHGFAADATVWAGLEARLRHDRFSVFAPDLPGHGAHPSEAATPQDLSVGLARAVADWTGEPPHVVAHSMGALPAIALAQEMALASLTLIAPLGLSHGIDAGFLRGLARPGSPGEVSHLLSRMVDGPLPLSAEAVEQSYAELSKGRLRGLAEALLGRQGQAVDLRASLAMLADRLPVRLILSHRDRIVPWEGALDVSPRIAVHHLPRAGHMPQWELADAVARIVGDAAGAKT